MRATVRSMVGKRRGDLWALCGLHLLFLLALFTAIVTIKPFKPASQLHDSYITVTAFSRVLLLEDPARPTKASYLVSALTATNHVVNPKHSLL